MSRHPKPPGPDHPWRNQNLMLDPDLRVWIVAGYLADNRRRRELTREARQLAEHLPKDSPPWMEVTGPFR